MATFEDIIEEVLLNLEGYSGSQAIFGTLNANIGATDITLTVAGPTYGDGSGFSAGLVEVGEELINGLNFDPSTGIFTSCLRGWRGTTGVAHLAGELLRSNPKFPRVAVKKEINNTIQNVFPKVASVKSYEFTFNGAVARYDIPSNVREVLQVATWVPGASKSWVPNNRFRFDFTGGSQSATGKSIEVWDGVPGRLTRIVYQADPQPLVNLNDDFVVVSGLWDWAVPLIVYGACWRLSSFLDAGNAVTNSAAQKLINQTQATSFGGQTISKYFYSLYQQALTDAQTRVQNMYPAYIHRNY